MRICIERKSLREKPPYDYGRVLASFRRRSHGGGLDKRGAWAGRIDSNAKSRRNLCRRYHDATRRLRQGLPLDDFRVRRAGQLGRGDADGRLRSDQRERRLGVDVPTLRPGRHGYRKLGEGQWFGHLVLADPAMRRFVAGAPARLSSPSKCGLGVEEISDSFRRRIFSGENILHGQ